MQIGKAPGYCQQAELMRWNSVTGRQQKHQADSVTPSQI